MNQIDIRAALRRAMVLAMALLLVPVLALAAKTTGKVTSGSLNLREKASKDSKCLQTLDKGDTVYITGQTGDWYKVTYGKYSGYVMKKYVKADGSVKNINTKESSKDSGKSAKEETKSKTEKLDWFKNGSKTIPKKAVMTIKDCKTGKTFKARRWSGANHIDAEPLTAADARVLTSLYGGYSWNRRAVLVRYNGHVYAASINGMPHGTETIRDNGFEGHFCIHFSGSMTHGSKRVDETHQSCVNKAMKYSW